MRKKMNKKTDKKVFRNTAIKTHVRNLPNLNYRGGIRF